MSGGFIPDHPVLRQETDTYDVWWKRDDDEELFLCTGLDPLKLVRRLIAANHNFGEITIVRVERSQRAV